jgi:hypothetical protein
MSQTVRPEGEACSVAESDRCTQSVRTERKVKLLARNYLVPGGSVRLGVPVRNRLSVH